MKRSGPLQRFARLAAHAELKRGDSALSRNPLRPTTEPAQQSELTRSPTPRTGPPTPQQQRRKEQLAAWVDLRLLVLERDGDACVRCGRTSAPLDVHHRRSKGMGGSKQLDHPANLIALCGWGNTTGCHGHVHAYPNTHGAAGGWALLEGEDPADVAVLYADGVRYHLDDDGGKCAA